MIVTIIKREILEYLKSSKLLIGLSLTVILITISTIINIGDFQQRRQDYLDARKMLNEVSGLRYSENQKYLVPSYMVKTASWAAGSNSIT